MTCNRTKTASGSWCASLARLSCLALLVLLCTQATVAAQVSPDPELVGERPTRNGEPTVVKVSMTIIDIDEIDDVNQRFSVDLFINARWQDPRLALPDAEREGKVRFMMVDEVWTPKILILNDRGLTGQLREGVEVDDLGNIS